MNAIGTAVTGGMLSATFIDLFYIPLLFVVVSGYSGKSIRNQRLRGAPLFRVLERESRYDTKCNADRACSHLSAACTMIPQYTRPAPPSLLIGQPVLRIRMTVTDGPISLLPASVARFFIATNSCRS